MDKKKENSGSLISSIGGLFTIIGMTLLAMKVQQYFIYLVQ
jgi:hypothetical protein